MNRAERRAASGKKRTGVCKLSQTHGTFVEAHLIPKSLTRPDQNGAPLYQLGFKTRPVRRWSSWYDPYLVTQDGENILTALDTWAVSEFRKHKLIWTSWDTTEDLGTLHTPIQGSPWGMRRIDGINPTKLRLFFLSLLWRAAATDLPEFSAVVLPPNDLERLRCMLVSGNPDPIAFYPSQLTQLSTIGRIHNQSPTAGLKKIPNLESKGIFIQLPIFRFYFDGLIAHVHRHATDDGTTAEIGNMIVGAESSLLVSTQTYEDSFQRGNVEAILSGNEKPTFPPGCLTSA